MTWLWILCVAFLVVRVLEWRKFLKRRKPKGAVDEVISTYYGERHQIVQRLKSPIDGSTVGWVLVNDYGRQRTIYNPTLVGWRVRA